MAFTISEIAQIAVNAKDLARATAFYRDRLRLPFLFEAPGMAFFRCGSVRLMLGVASEPAYDHPSSILYFRVGNVDEAHRTLEGEGVAFRRAPFVVHRTENSALWMAFFDDPEGNTLALMEERAA